MSITWWSASVVVRGGRRVRQTLFHTAGGSGRSTVRRAKERVVFRVGSCSEKIMSPTPVPEGCSVDAQAFFVFFLRAVVQPSFLLPPCMSCTKLFWSLEMPYLPRDAHMSIWMESVCFQTLPRYSLPRSWNCSSKEACLFLLKRPPVA